MMFSENRYPLFGIMLKNDERPLRASRLHAGKEMRVYVRGCGTMRM